ncbi:conserved hypothetical protein [Candidatus Accumulibacter aalborgensis]|uniref:YdjC family protein n=1 Tax=Candidatus Accumulibacter aalborgensis TaxID=1860102 RepID=A0A1A8XG08_9PROT|nr:ChbG/HpnK family deacetylase [Candidatus Accumulibacter aalborgensis]SBT03646.1 conserved hypothetical protein [Candidatus Accumulibacter aalborgensis]
MASDQWGGDTGTQAVKPMVVCADDFGMAPGVNAGILELAHGGRLSAVSCMSRGRFFRLAAPSLAGLPVDKGLHLNLTERLQGDEFDEFDERDERDERDEFALPLRRLLWSCWSRQIDARRVVLEIERQLDAFEAVLGVAPDYVDGHQHVHQFPVIRDCLLEVLRRRYPARLPWLRSTLPPVASTALALPQRFKAKGIGFLGARAFTDLASRLGFRMNAHLLGVYGFEGGEEVYARLLGDWLACAGAGDLLMCHPAGFADEGVYAGRQRVAEYAVLSGECFRSLLEEHGVVVRRLAESDRGARGERLAILAREVDALPPQQAADTRSDVDILGYNERGEW